MTDAIGNLLATFTNNIALLLSFKLYTKRMELRFFNLFSLSEFRLFYFRKFPHCYLMKLCFKLNFFESWIRYFVFHQLSTLLLHICHHFSYSQNCLEFFHHFYCSFFQSLPMRTSYDFHHHTKCISTKPFNDFPCVA